MSELTYIDLKQCILNDNDKAADEIRVLSAEKKFFLWNIMSAPGAGKTTFILEIIRRLGKKYRMAVIEGDIESTVDSQKIQASGIPVIQLRTGGDCHLDAVMIMEGLKELPLDRLDVVIIENIGNLVCPAEFDLGADLPSMLLSVPEGDDKAIKYPLMFSVTKALIVTKTDALSLFDFDFKALDENAHRLNPELVIFPLSAKTGEGVDDFENWICRTIDSKLVYEPFQNSF